jgi:hypothetical protein
MPPMRSTRCRKGSRCSASSTKPHRCGRRGVGKVRVAAPRRRNHSVAGRDRRRLCEPTRRTHPSGIPSSAPWGTVNLALTHRHTDLPLHSIPELANGVGHGQDTFIASLPCRFPKGPGHSRMGVRRAPSEVPLRRLLPLLYPVEELWRPANVAGLLLHTDRSAFHPTRPDRSDLRRIPPRCDAGAAGTAGWTPWTCRTPTRW